MKSELISIPKKKKLKLGLLGPQVSTERPGDPHHNLGTVAGESMDLLDRAKKSLEEIDRSKANRLALQAAKNIHPSGDKAYAVSKGGPLGLSSLIRGKAKPRVYTLDFDKDKDAKAFHKAASEKGVNVVANHGIKKQGINWIRTKGFKSVTMKVPKVTKESAGEDPNFKAPDEHLSKLDELGFKHDKMNQLLYTQNKTAFHKTDNGKVHYKAIVNHFKSAGYRVDSSFSTHVNLTRPDRDHFVQVDHVRGVTGVRFHPDWKRTSESSGNIERAQALLKTETHPDLLWNCPHCGKDTHPETPSKDFMKDIEASEHHIKNCPSKKTEGVGGEWECPSCERYNYMTTSCEHCGHKLTGMAGVKSDTVSDAHAAQMHRVYGNIAALNRTPHYYPSGSKSASAPSTVKSIKSKYPGVCSHCRGPVPAGSDIVWDTQSKKIKHPRCVESKEGQLDTSSERVTELSTENSSVAKDYISSAISEAKVVSEAGLSLYERLITKYGILPRNESVQSDSGVLESGLEHTHIANNPPKWVPSHHAEIWKALVLRNKHVHYGSAVNHYKRHVFKHGTKAASTLAKLALDDKPTMKAEADDRRYETCSICNRKVHPANYNQHRRDHVNDKVEKKTEATLDSNVYRDKDELQKNDLKQVGSSLKDKMVRYKNFGSGKSALDNGAKSHKVADRLSH